MRSIQYQNPSMIFLLAVLVIFLFLFNKFITRLRKNQETIITAVILLFYLCNLCAQYFGNSGYFDNPIDAFYFGSAFTIFERIIAPRIPKFAHRTIFSMLTVIIRTLVIPAHDVGVLAIGYVLTMMGIYLDADSEEKDQDLFRSYFSNRDQMTKFKHLVNDEIPEPLLSLTET